MIKMIPAAYTDLHAIITFSLKIVAEHFHVPYPLILYFGCVIDYPKYK